MENFGLNYTGVRSTSYVHRGVHRIIAQHIAAGPGIGLVFLMMSTCKTLLQLATNFCQRW